MKLQNVVIVLVCAFFPLGVCNTAGAENTLNLVANQKQLFLDNHAVKEMTGLKRTMHQPVKKGAVLRPDVKSDGCRVQTASAPVWVDQEKVYKLFYTAFPMEDHRLVGPALAISKDGVHWDKPTIGEVPIYGTKENNRYYVDGKRLRWPGDKFMDIICDPQDPDPARRYKGLLGAINRTPVVSPDGIHWTKLNVPKIPSSDTSFLIYDELGKRYLAILKTGSPFGRSAAVAFSKDFEHWTKPRLTFATNEGDQVRAKKVIRKRLADPGLQNPMFNDPDPATGWKPPKKPRHLPTWRAETYRMAVFPYEGLYIGLPQIYYPTGQRIPERNNTVGFHEIRLMMSRDPQLRPQNWKRLGNDKPFIETSRLDKGLVGNYDRQQLGIMNRPLVMGDELWFYYVGAKSRIELYQRNPDGSPRDPKTLSPQEKADLEDGWCAICLAVLRKDGFVSLDADENGGYVITKPFKVAENELYLNVDVKDGGYAKVEVLDEDGQALMGFEKDDCVSLEGNAVKQQVAWQTGSYWQLLAGQTVQLRIYLKNASLYSFWTE